METRKKVMLGVVGIVLLSVLSVNSGWGSEVGIPRDKILSRTPPEVFLLRPTSEVVDLKGKPNLEFKWSYTFTLFDFNGNQNILFFS